MRKTFHKGDIVYIHPDLASFDPAEVPHITDEMLLLAGKQDEILSDFEPYSLRHSAFSWAPQWLLSEEEYIELTSPLEISFSEEDLAALL